MHELSPRRFENVRSLFKPLRFHLASAAVLDGNSPGRIFVDDRAEPRAGFMLSPEGCYLAGDADSLAFIQALNQAIVADRALGDEVQVLFLIVSHAGWRDRLPAVFHPYAPMEMARHHYVCRTLCYDWRARLPDGCTVRRIDRSLLDGTNLVVPDHVTGWMRSNWGSVDCFLRDGFGCVTVSGNDIVSWSLADCVSGDRCEIGIRTVPAHRRRGLAAATAAATVEHALTHGFEVVGWHCPEDNLGSIATAEKVGFEKERDYTAFYAFLDREP